MLVAVDAETMEVAENKDKSTQAVAHAGSRESRDVAGS